MWLKERIKKSKATIKIYDKLIPYYCIMFPQKAIEMIYRQTYGRKLDLSNPRDLNEKINYLKLIYKDDPLVIKCADKWRMRQYVADNGCEHLLNDVYHIYHSANEINWEELPNKFALKFNKAAGMNIICTDKSKLNEEEVKKTVKSWFHAEYAERHCELHYRKAKPVVICEKYLGEQGKAVPIDYKVHCINGVPVTTMVCTDRDKDVKFVFVDNDYKRLEINTEVHGGGVLTPKPEHFEEMLRCSRILSKPFPLVRIDYYDFDGRLYIGEMTFTPQGGYIDFISQEGLDWLGDMLVLPPLKKHNKKKK